MIVQSYARQLNIFTNLTITLISWSICNTSNVACSIKNMTSNVTVLGKSKYSIAQLTKEPHENLGRDRVLRNSVSCFPCLAPVFKRSLMYHVLHA